MVEFAIVASFLLLLMSGMADFARVFFHAITVAGASSTGAFRGTYNNVEAVQTDNHETAAVDDTRNIGDGVEATSTMYCECTDGRTANNCFNPTNCGASVPVRIYTTTMVEQSFHPGFPL